MATEGMDLVRSVSQPLLVELRGDRNGMTLKKTIVSAQHEPTGFIFLESEWSHCTPA